jgi:hypothetical protein
MMTRKRDVNVVVNYSEGNMLLIYQRDWEKL